MPPTIPAAAVRLGAKFLVGEGEVPVGEGVESAPAPAPDPEAVPVVVVVAAGPEPEPVAVGLAAAVAQETTEGTLTPLAVQICWANDTAAAWSFASQTVLGGEEEEGVSLA